ACLRDPTRGVHLLEEGKGALDQSAVLQRVVAASEASICQQRLCQLGRGLDAFEHLQAPSESGVGLGSIADGLMDLSEDPVRRALTGAETASAPIRSALGRQHAKLARYHRRQG